MFGSGKMQSPPLASDNIDKMELSSEHFLEFTSRNRRKEKYVDASIKLDDGSVYLVHKYLLARDSEFFAKLFLYSDKQEYTIRKVSSEGFTAILIWIYKVKIEYIKRWSKKSFNS